MNEQKIVIILDDTLENWQACNVSAFLSSGLSEKMKGKNYQDKSDVTYIPLAKYPIMVYQTNKEKIIRGLAKANNRDVQVGLFTFDMFQTFNDEDNRKVVLNTRTNDLKLAGFICFGDKKEIDKVVRGYHFYGNNS